MGKSLAYKILESHLVEGSLTPGNEITIKMDQTLTQDSTGTMVYLQLEAMDVEKIKTELSVAYIDHNTLQAGFENADDHAFIKSIAQRHGVLYSKPGNGICHQLHLENYGKPGKTLLGSDSHTPTGGGLGMIAIGAGGLDVAVAMAKGTYSLTVPKVINVKLTGALKPWVSAKDVILYVLQQLSVKGGVGKIVEYTGEGVKTLSVTDRATITNMGAELGATTSIFPSDENTQAYLASQGRADDFIALSADEDAKYDEVLEVSLSELEPLAAMPHSPDNVDSIKHIGPIKVDQVAIGSCTNSSYTDLMKVAAILKGKKVHPDVSLVISPGSSKIMSKMAQNGALAHMIDAGARIIENACGPCIGMGQSPKSGAVSLRTFNRNFKGRSGTADADVYLVSPETAAISAVAGVLSDGREYSDLPVIADEDFIFNDNFVIYPDDRSKSEIP
ncbi:MAG: aconitate hydratase, partial [Clostridia bacterium]|nr:aconitate hydratase [Clostridia bacterium]